MLQTSHSCGASQNSTVRIFVLPEPIITKLGTFNYVGDPYSYANFS